MFDLICISLALFLSLFASSQFKVITYIVIIEFLAHQIAYRLGIAEPFLYLAYAGINLSAIFLLSHFKSHFAISALILINLCYNVLTISQYIYPVYDFYGLYVDFVEAIMVLELAYMVGITKYVSRKLGLQGVNNTNSVNRVFMLGNRDNNRGLL